MYEKQHKKQKQNNKNGWIVGEMCSCSLRKKKRKEKRRKREKGGERETG